MCSDTIYFEKLIIILFKQICQPGQGFVRRLLPAAAVCCCDGWIIKVACMLVVMAIQAQQFPVTPVRRIVVMIVITVVYGQLMQVFAGELP